MSVTAPRGFVASGVHAGIRRSAPDLAALRSTVPAVGGAMFSRNQVQAAPLQVNRSTSPGRSRRRSSSTPASRMPRPASGAS
jgi:N-acetylglutamate synthase/N-acetylornithine aminotransferase